MNRILLPEKEILGLGGVTLGDFWAWAYSDVVSNQNRGVFAEFIVGQALGAVGMPRVEWDAVDLHYAGKTIEVKASAYVQIWSQTKPSTITFDIAPKKGWDAATNTNSSQCVRNSDAYVFCLHAEKERNNIDVLDMRQWLFYVVNTLRLNERFGMQKSLALSRLEKLATPCAYGELKSCVDHCLAING